MRQNFLALLFPIMALALDYPNEIVETPLVLCEPERIVIKIKTSFSNPSHIYAEQFADDADCSTRNMNKVALRHGQCGMSTERTDNPVGVIQRICISVQLHPLFVTDADRSYCAQCVYVDNQVLNDFEQTLDISEAPPTELAPQFDVQSMPRCSYSIRRGSESGPEVHYAAIGDKVFHVWNCQGDNTGILVQNCHVEDGQGNRILIIDQNGCGVDQYVMATPMYTTDLTTAFQETRVFKFAQKTITRFICQIRICLRSDECKKLSPPKSCPTLEERIQQAKLLHDQPSAGLQEVFETAEAESALSEAESKLDSGAPTTRVQPPGTQQQDDDRNATLGSIYYGRRKRDASPEDITASSRHLRFSTSKGYPEVDLIGELRVLDTPEDVSYFERRSSVSAIDCVSNSTYSILLSSLIVVSILLITAVLVITTKASSYKNIITSFSR